MKRKIYNVRQDVSYAVGEKAKPTTTPKVPKGETLTSTKGNHGKHSRQHAGWPLSSLESGVRKS